MILLIDNYDSFTWNLAQALWSLGSDVTVVRNDAACLDDLLRLRPQALVVSPGPGRPNDAGVSLPLIRELSGRIPILGVCLGHQAIGEVFGATLDSAARVRHGKTSPLVHSGTGLFAGLPPRIHVGRYHSLSLRRETLPSSLEATAFSEDDGEIMAIAHRTHPTVGVQFHPESVLTPDGQTMLKNFLAAATC
jgi:anthranilate synthase/aminodeoxychorismate synthase-like glutamine amidotransferase